MSWTKGSNDICEKVWGKDDKFGTSTTSKDYLLLKKDLVSSLPNWQHTLIILADPIRAFYFINFFLILLTTSHIPFAQVLIFFHWGFGYYLDHARQYCPPFDNLVNTPSSPSFLRHFRFFPTREYSSVFSEHPISAILFC